MTTFYIEYDPWQEKQECENVKHLPNDHVPELFALVCIIYTCQAKCQDYCHVGKTVWCSMLQKNIIQAVEQLA